jgi:hypothetical protein
MSRRIWREEAAPKVEKREEVVLEEKRSTHQDKKSAIVPSQGN